MSTPIFALFREGLGGLPPASPVDFDRLVLPRSPNTCLAAPEGTPGVHIPTPPAMVDVATAWPVLLAFREGLPRVTLYGSWPQRHQVQWVVRSAVMSYPDIVAAELRPEAGGMRVFMYSRSLIGWSDLGVNRARVEAWLADFDRALRG